MAQYILNMGGYNNQGYSATVDMFRTTDSGVEAVTGHGLTLSAGREASVAASAGSYILAMGGLGSNGYLDTVDVFRATANGVEAVTGHGLTLSSARTQLAATACGSYIFAMGGYGSNDFSDEIDVFRTTDSGVEAVTGHNLTLSVARRDLAATACGNYILAMGGQGSGGNLSNAIDIFRVTDNGVEAVTGHGLTLSSARYSLAAASVGNYILAMGGIGEYNYQSNAIDVFRVTDNGVESVADHGLTLSVARYYLAAASAGNYILAMGGYGSGSNYYDAIDVFRATDNGVEAVREYNLKLSTGRCNLAAASVGNYILAMGGINSSGYSNAIDVFQIFD